MCMPLSGLEENSQQCQNLRYYPCPVWKTKKSTKSKPTQKLKHANPILQYFEYFCQMSAKYIIIYVIYLFIYLKYKSYIKVQEKHKFGAFLLRHIRHIISLGLPRQTGAVVGVFRDQYKHQDQ